MVPLGEVAQINPKPPKISEDTEVVFVGMADLDATQAKTDSGQVRRFLEVSKGYTVFQNADILVAKITPCFENNKIGQARLQRETGVGSTEFHVIRPGGHLDDRYLLHFLRQDRIRRQGEVRMTGSAGQRRVPVAFLQELKIPLPPLDEQRRIAAILDQADDLRVARQETLTHLDALAGSLFNEMFGSGGYETAELSEVVRRGTIVTYGIVQAGAEFEGGVPYIRTGDIVDGEIRRTGLRHTAPAIAAKFARSRVGVGDIVMSIRATVGTTALVPPELDGANLTQGTAKISPSDVATGQYLLHHLRSPGAQRWIQAQVKGATFREITLGALRQLPVPLAPLSLQEEFDRRLRRLTAARIHAGASSGNLDHLFASLQSRAFAGQL